MTTRRRSFLCSTLLATLGAPFVRLVRNGYAAETAARHARAFVVFQHTHNMRQQWWPQGSESSFTLSEPLSPLEPLREHCVFLHSMMMKSGLPPKSYTNHTGNTHILTAHATLGSNAGALGPSIDQVIADHAGKSTPVRSLNLWTAVNRAFPNATICYRGPRQGITMEPSPHAAFRQIVVGAGGMPSPEFDAVQKSRRSIIDNILADIKSLEPRLAGEERRMLDAHVDAVRTLERSLFGIGQREATVACKNPAASTSSFDFRSPRNLPQLIKLHTDVVVTAIACDVTRVAVIMIGNGNNDDVTFPWIGVNQDHHIGIQHNGNAVTEWTPVTKWFVGQYAQFLSAMKAVATPTGNLLTDSVTVLCHNMGTAHSIYNMGFVVGGGGRGRIKGNRFLPTGLPADAMKPEAIASHAELWLACAHALGLEHLQRFGDPTPEFCRGPLSGLLAS
jgi:hypothetical protein